MSEEKLKKDEVENNKENDSDDEDKKNIDNEYEPINENEMNNLLNKENKTTINTNEVADSLIINQKIQKLRNMKFNSDDLLKQKKYEEAINSYKNTIKCLLEEFNDKINVDIAIIDNLKIEIIVPCYQNISLCHMKLKNWLKMKK